MPASLPDSTIAATSTLPTRAQFLETLRLDEDFVDGFQALQIDEEAVNPTDAIDCSICLNSIDRPTRVHGDHVFCASCIRTWLQEHNTCPMCRMTLFEEEEQVEYWEDDLADDESSDDPEQVSCNLEDYLLLNTMKWVADMQNRGSPWSRYWQDKDQLDVLRQAFQRLVDIDLNTEPELHAAYRRLVWEWVYSRIDWHRRGVAIVDDTNYFNYARVLRSVDWGNSEAHRFDGAEAIRSLELFWHDQYSAAVLQERPTVACHPLIGEVIARLKHELQLLDGRNLASERLRERLLAKALDGNIWLDGSAPFDRLRQTQNKSLWNLFVDLTSAVVHSHDSAHYNGMVLTRAPAFPPLEVS